MLRIAALVAVAAHALLAAPSRIAARDRRLHARRDPSTDAGADEAATDADDASTDADDASPLAWLQARRDVFEPQWDWLRARREFSEIVKAGRRAEARELSRGQRAIQDSISGLLTVQDELRREALALWETEWKRERAVQNATRIFLEDEWARERAVRNATQIFLNDEWNREAELRRDAQRFLDDELAREEDLRREARAFVADEFERLADADEELAARIRGAPQITVCTAPISCGKSDGRRVLNRLERLAAAEEENGLPAPLVRCSTKCASNCRAGKVAVTLGAPRREVLFCDAAAAADCEDTLGYCSPADVEAAVNTAVDDQLERILARGRSSKRSTARGVAGGGGAGKPG
mmetsp:Transcript_20638/g.64913  ORF Transcript_20638/g.64913 Transcript_20638/m.64913 type:complete len:352 (+) Transcript_20638:682-1737(+)